MTADAVGGVWQYSIDLATGLTQQGARVLLATLGPRPSESQRCQALQIPGVKLVENDCALEWMENPWSDVNASGDWLLQLQADYKADVIHLNGYSHAVLAWNVPVLVVAHSCVFSWWRAVHGTVPGPEWDEYKHRVTQGLRAASAIVAPTAVMANSLVTEYEIKAKKMRVIPNFSFAPPSAPREKQPFILAAGRIWDEAKNLKMLSALAPRLQWELRIANGTLSHEALATQMDVAAIFAHPSLYEPFGLSVLEAAHAGCCLVLSDIPSLRELWDGGAAFVDPRDEDQWARELNRLANAPEERSTLAHLACARAKLYDPGKSLEQYWKLYRDLAMKKREEAAA